MTLVYYKAKVRSNNYLKFIIFCPGSRDPSLSFGKAGYSPHSYPVALQFLQRIKGAAPVDTALHEIQKHGAQQDVDKQNRHQGLADDNSEIFRQPERDPFEPVQFVRKRLMRGKIVKQR